MNPLQVEYIKKMIDEVRGFAKKLDNSEELRKCIDKLEQALNNIDIKYNP